MIKKISVRRCDCCDLIELTIEQEQPLTKILFEDEQAKDIVNMIEQLQKRGTHYEY